MSKGLIKNAKVVATMGQQGEVEDCDILFEDGVILQVGRGLDAQGAEEHSASGAVVTPGLINTHHHLVLISKATTLHSQTNDTSKQQLQ